MRKGKKRDYGTNLAQRLHIDEVKEICIDLQRLFKQNSTLSDIVDELSGLRCPFFRNQCPAVPYLKAYRDT